MLTKREISVLELKRKKLLQNDIAKELGISQPAVSSIYNNAVRKIRESKETIKIARRLKVDA